MAFFPKSYCLATRPFLDEYNKCYINIVTINNEPDGPLSQLVHLLKLPKLSKFQQDSACYTYPKCALALSSMKGYYMSCCNSYNRHGIVSCNTKKCCDLMTPDEIPDLFSFLIANGYIVDTKLTMMMNFSEVKLSDNRIIAFITYNPSFYKPNIYQQSFMIPSLYSSPQNILPKEEEQMEDDHTPQQSLVALPSLSPMRMQQPQQKNVFMPLKRR